MAEYTLGRAKGTIEVDYDGSGVDRASRGMDDLESRARRTRDSFQGVATTAGIAAGALAAGIGLAVNAAIDFEARISAIGAVSGATEDDLEKLRKKALQLGADTAFSASEGALAMEELVKAGLSVEEVLNGAADATVALAAAGGVDLPEAAEIASNAMNQFGLAAEDLPRIADLIAGAANASAIDVSQFGFSMSQAGAVANLVGVSFEDLAAAIALMGNQGIVGSDAGTSLKTMLQNLQPTTEKQTTLMRELGLVTEDGANAFFDQEGKLKSLTEVAGILNGALSGMTDQQRAMALETLFGSDAIRAAAVIAGAGADGFRDIASALGEVSAQEVAEQRLNNVAGAIEQLKGSVETAAIQFGTQLLPAIRLVTEFITGLVNKFSELDPRWQQLIAFGAVAVTALLGVVAAIALVGAAIAGVVAAIGAVKIAAIIAAVIAGVIIVATAVKTLYDNSEEFRNLLGRLWESAKTVFEGMLNTVRPLVEFFRDRVIPTVKEVAAELIERLGPAFRAIGDFIEQHVVPMFQKIQAKIQEIMPTLIEIGNFLLGAFRTAWTVIGAVLGFLIPIIAKVAGFLADILGPVISFLIGLIPVLWNILKFGAMILGGIVLAVIEVGKFFGEVFMFIWDVVSSVIGFIGGLIGGIWNIIGAPIEAALSVIGALFSLAWSVIQAGVAVFMLGLKTLFGLLDEYIVQPVRAAWDFIWLNVIQPVMNAVTSFLQEKWDQIKAIWDTIYNFIVPPIKDAWDTIKSTITTVMDTVRNFINEKWEQIKALWQAAVDRVVGIADRIREFIDKVKAFFNDLKNAASGGTDEFVAFVKGIPGRVLDALANFGSLLWQKGRDLIQGLINGVKSMAGAVGDAISGIVSGITDWLPGSPAKKGPLSGRGYVLYRGQALAEDLAAGIVQSTIDTERAVRAMTTAMASEIPTDITVTRNLNAAAAGASTTTFGDININVPLEDLRSIQDVQDLLDFIDRLRNDSRRGVTV